MPNTPNSFDNFYYNFAVFAIHAIWCVGYFTMIFCFTGLALCVIVFVIMVLVQIAYSIRDYVKKYRNRSNNCGDGAPEEIEKEIVEDKEKAITEGEDKDKESFV